MLQKIWILPLDCCISIISFICECMFLSSILFSWSLVYLFCLYIYLFKSYLFQPMSGY